MGKPSIKMTFGDLSSAAGLKALNEFLAEHSYIEGYVPSQADVAVFDALKGKAGARKQFPKSQKDAASYVSGGAAPAAADDDDDDDVDLFGSDDEEEESEEAAKIRQERLDAYAAKKAKKPA